MYLLMLLAVVALGISYFAGNYLALKIFRATGRKFLAGAVRILGTLILSALLVISLGRLALLFMFREPSSIPFEPARWKSAAYSSNVRYRMRNDLLQRHRLVGAAKTDLYELLGSPTHESVDGLSASYMLGPDPKALKMDNVLLSFDFTGGRVEKYEFTYD